MVLNKKIVVA